MYDSIPKKLKNLNQWVLYRLEKRGEKITKIPYSVDGSLARSNDPNTWGTFADATSVVSSYDGIGFMFSEDDPFIGIDFDDAIIDGKPSELVIEWAKRIPSYSELSQSKSGVHIIAEGKLPEGKGRNNQKLGIEMYDRGRFFVMTGNHIKGSPKDVLNGSQPAIDELYGLISPPVIERKETPPKLVSIDDKTLLDKMFSSANGHEIEHLFNGNYSAKYESQSEADQALCCHLAFWTQKDSLQIDRLFRQSGLYREEKWNRNARAGETYGQGTITRAIELTSDVYDPISNDAEMERVLSSFGEKPESDINDYLMGQGAHDHGNALCVQALYPRKFTFCDAFGWMVRTGTHFERENSQYIVNSAITETLLTRRSIAVIEDKEEIVKNTKPTSARKNAVRDALRDLSIVSVNDFDSDLDLVNTRTGVVDLRTGQLLTHESSGQFTYCLPVEYKPEENYNFWQMFLSQVIDQYEYLSEWIQMAVGYSITGHTSEECMFYVYGPTRSGKGTFVNTILSMLGEPLSRGVQWSTFTKRRDGDNQNFDLAPLKACRFIAASESKKNEWMNEATVKTITGGDRISCSFKGKDSFDYQPQFKIWLMSNHMVRGDVDDDAFWHRLRVLSLPNSFKGNENKGLKNELVKPEVLSSIFSWAVVGAQKWHNSPDGLVTPIEINYSTDSHRKSLDEVQQWLDECTEEKEGNTVTNANLMDSYKFWCEENGYKPKGAHNLGRALVAKNYERSTKKINGKLHRGYMGLILTSQM